MHYFFYKVNRADIVKIKCLVEAFENILNMSTVDENVPKIQISVAPDFHDDAVDILEDMQRMFYMEQLAEDGAVSQGKY